LFASASEKGEPQMDDKSSLALPRREAAVSLGALTGLAGLLLPLTAGADFALPQHHGGLRDIVLVYRGGEPRRAEELLPLVAYLDRYGQPRAWFFDAFLLSPTGGLAAGADWFRSSNQAHWQAWLEAVFGSGGLVEELARAVAQVAARLGPPPRPREVIIAIPYPRLGEPAFGDLDGDGRLDDLGSDTARREAVRWLVEETVRRWGQAQPPQLHLWGMYWYNEGIEPQDYDLVRAACNLVHARGLKMHWIPWFGAPGWDKWRQLGIDVAVLQPNYAFMPALRGAHLPEETRLEEAARLAREAGMGVEMETRYALETAAYDRACLRLYLNHAVTDGYAAAVRAHFHSMDQYQRLAKSRLPEARQLYDDLFALHQGKLPLRPASLLADAKVWLVRQGARRMEAHVLARPEMPPPKGLPLRAGDSLVLELPAPRVLDEGRLLLAHPADSGAPRCVEVWGQEPGQRAERKLASVAEGLGNGGWLIVTWPAVRLQALRFVPVPFPGQRLLVRALAAYPSAHTSLPTLALGRPYVVRPQLAGAARYPDSGGELTDGQLTEKGFSDGRTVGWLGVAQVVVELELPEAVEVEKVRCHVEGGGYAAVYFPMAMWAAVSSDGHQWKLLSNRPGHLRVEVGSAQEQGQLALGWVEQEAAVRGEQTRWVRITLTPRGWLMLSEIEVISGGQNAARGCPYRCWPYPTAEQRPPYPDDGLKLTDGVASTAWEAAVGWNTGEGEVEVDLGSPQRIGAVRAYVLGGGAGAVYFPAAVEVSVSADAKNWSPPKPATVPRAEEKDKYLGGWAEAALAGEQARYVLVKFKAARGWLMVSEIEVLGPAQR
jgi:hypothetical protein